MADLASFSLSDRRAAPHSRAHQLSADRRFGDMARPNGWACGREGGRKGGREGRGGEGRGEEGEGRAEQGRGGEGEGRGGQGRGGEGRGRGGDCPHFPQTRTFVTAEPSRPPAKRVTG